MAVIKNTEAERIARPGFLDLGDLRRQGEELLACAGADAARILEDARAQPQRLLEDAEARGAAEGRRRGEALGRTEGEERGRAEALAGCAAQVGELVAAWRAALERFEAERSAMLLSAREDVLALAVALGEKVTHRMIALDPAAVTDQVAEAVALVTAPGAATIAVNPQDRPLVESVLGGLVERFGNLRHARLRDDPSVGRGGCMVFTEKGVIDARVDTQLERIAGVLGRRARGD